MTIQNKELKDTEMFPLQEETIHPSSSDDICKLILVIEKMYDELSKQSIIIDKILNPGPTPSISIKKSECTVSASVRIDKEIWNQWKAFCNKHSVYSNVVLMDAALNLMMSMVEQGSILTAN